MTMKGDKLSSENRTKCEIWTRLNILAMGYIRSKDYFNKGKKSEFAERKYFTEEKTMERLNEKKTNSNK